MIKFTDEDNKEAMSKAFELFAMCMSAGPCNNCVFFDRHSLEDLCSIGYPNSWSLFDPDTKNGSKNRKLVLDILDEKENRTIKLKGRILLFDTVNKSKDIFPKDCEIDIPEKIPLLWNFDHNRCIGVAEVTKDDKGLIAKAEITPNIHYTEDDVCKVFKDNKFGVGGYYNKVKKHSEGNSIVIDEATLREVSLVLDPVNDEYYFEIVKEG